MKKKSIYWNSCGWKSFFFDLLLVCYLNEHLFDVNEGNLSERKNWRRFFFLSLSVCWLRDGEIKCLGNRFAKKKFILMESWWVGRNFIRKKQLNGWKWQSYILSNRETRQKRRKTTYTHTKNTRCIAGLGVQYLNVDFSLSILNGCDRYKTRIYHTNFAFVMNLIMFGWSGCRLQKCQFPSNFKPMHFFEPGHCINFIIAFHWIINVRRKKYIYINITNATIIRYTFGGVNFFCLSFCPFSNCTSMERHGNQFTIHHIHTQYIHFYPASRVCLCDGWLWRLPVRQIIFRRFRENTQSSHKNPKIDDANHLMLN